MARLVSIVGALFGIGLLVGGIVLTVTPKHIAPVAIAAIPPTVAISPPMSTSTPQLDKLMDLVVQDGDFPKSFTLRRDPMPWRIYPGIPSTQAVYYYEIIEGNDQRNEVGHVAVVSYNDTGSLNKAYEAIRAEADFNQIGTSLPFGEFGIQSGPVPSFRSSDIMFQTCNTIIHISLEGDTLTLLRTYGEKLYNRIKPAVCP